MDNQYISAVAAVFIAQAFGMDLSAGSQLGIFMPATLL